MRRKELWYILMTFTVVLAAVSASSSSDSPDGDWRHYNRDNAGTRFSPLSQITPHNVAKLKLAWSFKPAPEGAVGHQVVPVVVNGVAYVAAGDFVIAVDGQSGAEIWRYKLNEGQSSPRGVSYWPGDKTHTPRIFFTGGVVPSKSLIALDARSGRLVSSFGKNGIVALDVGYHGVPTVAGNVIALGATTLETEVDPKVPGDTRAFDAVTGKLLWVFHTVPRPGEVGHESWLNEGWKDRSGTNVWGWQMSYDDHSGLLYMPIGGPAANYYGGDRPGNNLFANSIVAVDAKTGKYRWHFQLIHHDLWDYDNPPAPSLIDIKRNGKVIPALAQLGKTGWMFILNRETGEPVFGVEERPVPKGEVPGEWYSPTQPFPIAPPALARMTFAKEDLVTADDTNAVHAANCRALWDRSGGFENKGPFTPFVFHEEGKPVKSTVHFPGAIGGTNWGGTAIDPNLGYVFAYTMDLGSVGWIERKTEGRKYSFDEAFSKLPYSRGSIDGGGPFFFFNADAGEGIGKLPCQKPPWGEMNAVNASTGEIVWRVRVGVAKGLPKENQNTGLSGGFTGPTATAGGLLFYSGLSDNLFRAFDSKTGSELWSYDLGASATDQPISYQVKGKQFIAIVAGGKLWAFNLGQGK